MSFVNQPKELCGCNSAALALLNIEPKATISQRLNSLTSNQTVGSITVSNDATINGTLTLQGALQHNNVYISSVATPAAVSITNEISGAVQVAGGGYFGENLLVKKGGLFGGAVEMGGALEVAGAFSALDTSTFSGDVSITSITNSTNANNGALSISGGLGVLGNVNALGAINTTSNCSVGNQLKVGSSIVLNGPTGNISATSLSVPSLNVNSVITTTLEVATSNKFTINSSGAVVVGGSLNVSGATVLTSLNITAPISSSSPLTGALVVGPGGIGVGGSVNVGGNVAAATVAANTLTATAALNATGTHNIFGTSNIRGTGASIISIGTFSNDTVLIGNKVVGTSATLSSATVVVDATTFRLNSLAANSVPIVQAGKEVVGQVLTNGQLLIGSTGGTPVAATLLGTANQVNIANGAGSITLSLPQSIGTGSSPSFNNLTLAGTLQFGALTTISATTPSSSRVYTIPDAGGAASFIMSTSTAGQTISNGLQVNTSFGVATTASNTLLLNRTGTGKIAIQDGGSDRFSIASDGSVVLQAANVSVSPIIIQTLAEATSGSILVQTGMGTAGGSIVMNTQGTTPGALSLRQNGTNRINVSTAGAVELNGAASQSIRILQNNVERFAVSAGGSISCTAAAGQSVDLVGTSGSRMLLDSSGNAFFHGRNPDGNTNVLAYGVGNVLIYTAPGASGGIGIGEKGSADRFNVNADGRVSLTSAALQNLELFTGNSGSGTSGSIALTTGTTTTTGGSITLNAQGVAAGLIALRQNGTDRISIGSVGSIDLNTAVSQQLRLRQNGSDRITLSTAGRIAVTAASGQELDLSGKGGRLLFAADGSANLHGENPNGNTNIFSYGTGSVLIFTDAASSGNVGLGVKGSPTNISITSAGAVSLNTASATQLSLRQNSIDRIFIASDGAVVLNADTAKGIFLRQNSVDRLFISTAGSISGNTATGAALSLRQDGTERIGFDGSGQIILNTAASQLFSVRQNSAERIGFSTTGAIVLNTASSQSLQLQQNAISRMTISAAGAITLQSAAGQLLDVQGPAGRLQMTATDTIFQHTSASNNLNILSATSVRISTDVVSAGSVVMGVKGAVDNIQIAASGQLRLNASAAQELLLQQNGVNRFQATTDGTLFINAASAKSLSLQQGGTSRFVVDFDGTVFATSAPTREVRLTTDNSGGSASGAILLTTGTGSSGGNIVLNAQGTIAGAIGLQQNGVNRFVIGSDGALVATTPATKNIVLNASTATPGAIGLQQNDINRILIDSAGSIALNTASAQLLQLQQNGSNRIQATGAGAVLITPELNQDVQLTTANVGTGTSGAVRLTSGTGPTGGVIALNTQGTTPGTINLRQNGTDRLVVNSGGNVSIFNPAGQIFVVQHAGVDRFACSDASTVIQTAAASTNSLRLRPNEFTQLEFFSADGSVQLNNRLSGAMTLRTEATALASTNSGSINISTGNAAGPTSNSGSINMTVGTATDTGGSITLNTQGTTLGEIRLQQNGTNRMQVFGASGSMIYNTGASGTVAIRQNGTDRFRFDSLGSIGIIGASTSSQVLISGHSGSILFDGAGNVFMRARDPDGSMNMFTVGTGNVNIYTNPASTGSIRIGEQNNLERIVVNSAGAVSLLSNIGQQLSLQTKAAGASTSGSVLVQSGTGATGGDVVLNAQGTVPGTIRLQSNGVDRLTVAGNLTTNVNNTLLQSSGTTNITSTGAVSVATSSTTTFASLSNTLIRTENASATVGNITLQTGNAIIVGGVSGKISLLTGTSDREGTGDIELTTGKAENIDLKGTSGNIRLTTGENITDTSGNVELLTGTGIVSGDLSLQTGNAFTTTGNVVIRTGDVLDSGNSGDVLIGSGMPLGGNSGAVRLQQNGVDRFAADPSGRVSMSADGGQEADVVGFGGRLQLATDGNAYLHARNSNGTVNIFSYGTGNVQLYTDTASSGAVGLGVKGDTNAVRIASTGAVTINSSAAQPVRIRQNNVDRFAADAAGTITVAAGTNANLNLTTAGTGSIVQNSTNLVRIQQSGVDRISVESSGEVRMNPSAGNVVNVAAVGMRLPNVVPLNDTTFSWYEVSNQSFTFTGAAAFTIGIRFVRIGHMCTASIAAIFPNVSVVSAVSSCTSTTNIPAQFRPSRNPGTQFFYGFFNDVWKVGTIAFGIGGLISIQALDNSNFTVGINNLSSREYDVSYVVA